MNATDIVVDRAANAPDHVAFERKIDGVWRPVATREFADEIIALAGGLIAAGVEPGDRIAIMSGTSYEWVLCDFAIQMVGAVTVPIYETSSPPQIEWFLTDSGANRIFVADAATRAVVERAGVPAPCAVWTMDDGDIARLSANGREVGPEPVHQRRQATTADTLATIVYTSGTTGRPKGCMISHGNLLAEINSLLSAEGVRELMLTADSSLLLFLPLAHILARIVQFAAFLGGARIAHTSDIRNVTTLLAEFKPTLLIAVPRVFEKVYNTAARTAASTGRGRIFQAAEATALAYSHAVDTGGPSLPLKLRHRLFDRLVYQRLRAATGGRVAYAVSGGAPLGPQLCHFMRGIGINVLEGWGLTETTAAVTFNLPAAQQVGSVGRPLPGREVRIADNGEVLVRGDTVFQGYWHNELDTADAIDADGWFHTGDLGEVNDGFLTITGRAKDLLITASGKNVAPLFLENALDQFYQANLIARIDYADILYIAPIMFGVGVAMAAVTAYVTLRLYVRK